MWHPTISPHDPDTVLLGCDMTGSYLTRDGGRSWRGFHLRSSARGFAFDPVDPERMYVAAVGLWRSDDSGVGWGLVYPDPGRVQRIDHTAELDGVTDEASVRYIVDDDDAGEVTAFAVDPAEPAHLVLAVRRDRDSIIMVSRNLGATWRDVANIPGETVQAVYVDPISAADDREMFAFTDRSVWAGGVGGLTCLDDGPSAQRYLHQAAAFGLAGARMYRITQDRIFVSHDRGRTWTESALPGPVDRLRAIGAAPSHPDRAFVSYQGLRVGGDTLMGFARSDDGGLTWVLCEGPAGGRRAFGVVDDDWIADAFGPDYGGCPTGFGASPTDPDHWYATSTGCAWTTTDGGETWRQTYFEQVGDDGCTTSGLDLTTTYGLFHDPFDADRRFIAYTDIGVCRSEDGGRSWVSSIDGVPPDWHNTTYWLAFDPDMRGRLWGVMSYHHDLPRTKMYGPDGPPEFRGGVCMSDDGGRTWRVTTTGMPETGATHIVLDPTSPVESRTLYVAAMGHGVFRSDDSGASWTPANHGITESNPLAWRLEPTSAGTLWLVVYRRGPATPGALYRSDDQARSWRKVTLPTDVDGPSGLCVDARDPSRLYLAAWQRPGTTTGGGVHLSTDAGQSWRPVLDHDRHIYDVTQDPNDPEVLYAGGFESNLWRTADSGQAWTRVPGFNVKWGHRVQVDPLAPDMIYVTTFGNGVWHGPAVGDPHAREDIVTAAVAYNAQ